MLATSFKDADEIRTGNLLSLPGRLNARRLGAGLVVGLHRRRLPAV